MRVLEDQREGGDVLVVHAFAAAHLDGMLDALVDLLGSGLARVGQLGQRAVGEGGQDLEGGRSDVIVLGSSPVIRRTKHSTYLSLLMK